jgi:acyl carrier protein
MIETIRRVIDEKGHLGMAAARLSADADLYAAGLTPFAAIQIMLELERRLDIEFPKSMLNRRSMATIGAIASLLLALQAQAAHPQAA